MIRRKARETVIKGAELTIFHNLLSSICEQMGISLKRGAFSPNIRDRNDYSCALFDSTGNLVAQACHIPVHLGAMAFAVRDVVTKHPLKNGDILILNDPFAGGTHLPDITVIGPFYHNEKIEGSVANRAHHSDIGGIAPGSMSPCSDITMEGLLITPSYLYEAGILNRTLLRTICNGVRTPVEREGDLRAQTGSLNTGLNQLQHLTAKYGIRKIRDSFSSLTGASAKYLKAKLVSLPQGTASFTDYLDNDGMSDSPLKIHVSVTIEKERAIVDFSGSDNACAGNLNCPLSVTASAMLYAFRCLLPEDCPSNCGLLKPLTLIVPQGSLLHATYPSAVSAGNVETSQRIVDTILGALSQIAPLAIPAASCGSMNNLSLGNNSSDPEKSFTYYETIAGGAGASSSSNGASAIQTHMTNTLNTPVEVLESHYPLKVTQYSVRWGSGGNGEYTGGNGVVREIVALEKMEASLLTERRTFAPWGIGGGGHGQKGLNEVIRKDGTSVTLSGKTRITLEPLDTLRISTPGGGGYSHGKKEKED